MNKILVCGGAGLSSSTIQKALVNVIGNTYEETQCIHIKSLDELTLENIDKWNDQGIKLIIIDKPIPERSEIILSVEPIIKDIYLEKAKDFPIEDREEVKFKKEQHKYAQMRHSRFNYKRR